MTVSKVHVLDTVQSYAENDVVNVYVGWEDSFSSKYFAVYSEEHQKARAKSSPGALTLKGELWFATASVEQRLFDIQEALGGQLIQP